MLRTLRRLQGDARLFWDIFRLVPQDVSELWPLVFPSFLELRVPVGPLVPPLEAAAQISAFEGNVGGGPLDLTRNDDDSAMTTQHKTKKTMTRTERIFQ